MADVLTVAPRHARSEPERGHASAERLEVLVGFPVAAILLAWVLLAPRQDLRWPALFFVLCIAAVELIPLPAGQGRGLPIGLPVMMSVALLYSPWMAAAITWLGACDIREFRREIPIKRGVWERSEVALAILAGSWMFHLVGKATDPLWLLLAATLGAAIVVYAINTMLAALRSALDRGATLIQAAVELYGGRPAEFAIAFIGLGVLGAVVARFYLTTGAWSVVAFMAPLVVARQLFFERWVLADRLAAQNELMAEQTARIDSLLRRGHGDLGREPLSARVSRVLFEGIVRDVVAELGDSGSRVEIQVQNNLPVLNTDRELLGLVLFNLLDNALKFSPSGTSCELDAGPLGREIYFRVTDHGIGIDQNNLERIFDRFYQVDPARTQRFGGGGLGLWMARDLLDRLGGAIMVESTPGVGSRFTVNLPVSIRIS